jgi:flagellar biosynthetic protein FlhB
VVSGDKLIPKLSRISPISNAKNKYGANGLFEFGKSTVKLIVYSVALTVFLMAEAPLLLLAPALGAPEVVGVMMQLSVDFLFVAIVITIAIGVVDILWQHAEHIRKNRMSYQEIRDELKEQEGDATLKQARRQKGYDIATNRMIADVPKADVVIVNPEHYAIALQWDRGAASAPICIAKGLDDVALQIREVAVEANIPIQQDAPTARQLFADVALGQEIWPEHYEAVAAAIRFAEHMRQRARHGR